MIFIYNRIGLGMALAAALMAGLLAALLCKFDWFLSYGKPVCFVAAGVFASLLDLWYRMTRGEGSLLHPRRGGQLFFIPIWILGGAWILAGLCETLDGKPEVSARESHPAALPSYSYSSQTPSSRSLKLAMLSGVGEHRIATINGEPFAEGESHTLTVGSTKVTVQCTEIHERSVVVTISGDSEPHELILGQPLVLNRR